VFCSVCGVAVAQGLSYCNYCGASLNDDRRKSGEMRPETLVFGMLATFIFGIIAITALMAAMKNAIGMQLGEIVPFAAICFLLMLILEGVFIGLLLQRTRAKKPGTNARLHEKTTKELDAAQSRLLAEPVASVTEHTTRAFDSVYKERQSK
jgi:predicted nucleic acid-binding Zn ribbon protein